MTSSTAEPTQRQGLTSEEAARRLEESGPNTLPTRPPEVFPRGRSCATR